MKLCLGTVQFGMDYGICGGRRADAAASVALLGRAVGLGVDAIDTAAAYGDAEKTVGSYLGRSASARDRLHVISKFGQDALSHPDSLSAAESLERAVRVSLERLQTPYLDAYICHTPTLAGDAEVASAMAHVRDRGLARHVGFSVYETEEARRAIETPGTDFIQVPYSILDQRMAREGVFEAARKKDIDVYVRSVFVQGLALMEESAIPAWHAAARPLVRAFADFAREAGVSRRVLAMAYVRRQEAVSHIVFGVDNEEQLRENVEAFSEEVSPEILNAADRRFALVDPQLVMPNKWRMSR